MTTKRPLAALWVRVSTGEQSTTKDIASLQGFAAKLGMDVGPVYDVTGSAWKGDHRKALERMLRDAKAGHFDVLLVTDLTRLSREGGDETLWILKQLVAVNVPLRSIGDPDMSGPLDFSRRLSAMVKGELAHEQSNWRSLATRRGLAKARAEGKVLGRPRGRRDAPGHIRPREGLKAEQARRRLACVGAYRKRNGAENGQDTNSNTDRAD